MERFQPEPALFYVLAVIGATWLLRRSAVDYVRRRGLSARQAVKPVLLGAVALCPLLGAINLALDEPWAAFAFNVGVVFVQAGALLLTLRLAEAEAAFPRSDRSER